MHVLQIGIISYQQVSWRESDLVQKPLSQIPKTFSQEQKNKKE